MADSVHDESVSQVALLDDLVDQSSDNCKYIDLEQDSTVTKDMNHKYCALHLNIRSLPGYLLNMEI